MKELIKDTTNLIGAALYVDGIIARRQYLHC